MYPYRFVDNILFLFVPRAFVKIFLQMKSAQVYTLISFLFLHFHGLFQRKNVILGSIFSSETTLRFLQVNQISKQIYHRFSDMLSSKLIMSCTEFNTFMEKAYYSKIFVCKYNKFVCL